MKEISIEVIIDSKGNVKTEAKGFVGGECLKATKNLEEALGKVENRKMKPEAAKQRSIADKTMVGGK